MERFHSFTFGIVSEYLTFADIWQFRQTSKHIRQRITHTRLLDIFQQRLIQYLAKVVHDGDVEQAKIFLNNMIKYKIILADKFIYDLLLDRTPDINSRVHMYYDIATIADLRTHRDTIFDEWFSGNKHNIIRSYEQINGTTVKIERSKFRNTTLIEYRSTLESEHEDITRDSISAFVQNTYNTVSRTLESANFSALFAGITFDQVHVQIVQYPITLPNS